MPTGAAAFCCVGGHGTLEACTLARQQVGVLIRDGSEPMLVRCTIRDCTAEGVRAGTGALGTLQSCEILWVEGAAVSLTDGASTSFIDCEMGTGRVKHRLLDGISSGAKGIVALNRAGGSFHRCHLNNHSESAVEVCISSCLLLKLILVYDTPRSRLRELDVLYGFVCVGLSSCGWCTDWQWRGSFLQ